MTVALVLGAGGPVGYAFHAGVLAALADAGWDPRGAGRVVGTSIGAVTAALLRAGMSAADLFARVTDSPLSAQGAALLEEAGEWPTFPTPADHGAPRWGHPASPALLKVMLRSPRRVRAGLVLAALTNAGTVDPSPIVVGFDRLFESAWPAGTRICAVDLDSGERVVFGAPGAPPVDIGRAVAASCAVPSYFAPVEVAGRRFVDGGIYSPANTDPEATGPGAELSAVVVSMPMGRQGPPGRRGVDLPGRRVNHTQALRPLAPLVEAGIPVLVVEPSSRELELMHYDAFDRAHLPEIAVRIRETLGRRLSAAQGHGRRDARTAAVLAALLDGGPGRPEPHPEVEVEVQSMGGTGTGGSGPT